MIEFHDVCVCYEPQKRHPVQSLDGLTLHIEQGDWVFLVGPSGAGKSSLLKLIYAGTRAQSGRVVVDGEDITAISHREVPNLRRKIGIVFQDFQLLNEKTAWENVAFTLRVIGTPQSIIVREVPRALETVGLTHRAEAYPHELSGGEQQRIAIARAIVNNPKILLADEPTGQLDPQTAHEVGELLTKINRELGTTIVMATHDNVFVDALARRVVRLNAGKVVKDEDPGTYGESDGYAQHRTLQEANYVLGSAPAVQPVPREEAPALSSTPLTQIHETSAEEVRIAAAKAQEIREAEELAKEARAAEVRAAKLRAEAEAREAEIKAAEAKAAEARAREAEIRAAEERAREAEARAARIREAEAKAEQERLAEIRAAEERAARAKAEEERQAAVRAAEARAAEEKAAEEMAAQIRAAEARAEEERAAVVRAAEIRAAEIRAAEIRAAEQRAAEMREREAQARAAEVRMAEARAAQQREAENRAAQQREAEARAAQEKAAQEELAAQERRRQQLLASQPSAPTYTPPVPRETPRVITSEPEPLEYSAFDRMLEETTKEAAEAPAQPPQFRPTTGSWVAGNISPEAYDSYDDPMDFPPTRPMARRIAPSETPPPPPSAHPLDPHSFVTDPDAPLGSPENPIVQYE